MNLDVIIETVQLQIASILDIVEIHAHIQLVCQLAQLGLKSGQNAMDRISLSLGVNHRAAGDAPKAALVDHGVDQVLHRPLTRAQPQIFFGHKLPKIEKQLSA